MLKEYLREHLNLLRERFNPKRKEYFRDPEQLILMPAAEAVNFIIWKMPKIHHFTVVGHRPTLLWGRPSPHAPDKESQGPIFRQRSFRLNVPRWAINDPKLWSKLERLLSKVDVSQYKGTIPVDEALKHWPPENRRYDLAMTSKVYLKDGSKRYLPMLEFGLKHTKARHLWIQEEISSRGEHGLLLSSGDSYQFYFLRLLDSRKEWEDWMRSWFWKTNNQRVLQCLKDHYNSLRLFSGPEKPGIHRVIDVL